MSEQERRIRELSEVFRNLGADDPADWARSEVEEDIPQLATFLLLRKMWRDAMPWADDPRAWIEVLVHGADDPSGPFPDAGQALRRILAAGADPDDVAKVARMVAFEALFGAVHAIDEGYEELAPDDAPGWLLAETDAEGEPTGRVIAGLHESLLSVRPGGEDEPE